MTWYGCSEKEAGSLEHGDEIGWNEMENEEDGVETGNFPVTHVKVSERAHTGRGETTTYAMD